MRIFKKPIIIFLYLILYFLIFFLKFYFLDKFFLKILIKFKNKKKHIIKRILKRNNDNPEFAIYNEILERIETSKFDYVFIDGGHKYETVLNDLKSLKKVIENNGVILCDDYDLTYAPGVKKAIDEFIILNNFNLRVLNSRFAEITKDST